MDERLDFAPCGYLSLAEDGTMLSINHTLLELLGFDMDEVQGKHIQMILTKSTAAFFQFYFFPMTKVQEKVEEMFVTLQSKCGENIPALFNARRHTRDGIVVNDCILMTMNNRHKYEQAVLMAKRAADEKSELKKRVIDELERVRRQLELKQKELVVLNEKLHGLSITDELTNIHNRRSYSKALADNLSLFNRTAHPFSLLMIDVDHFKHVNDTYGHLMGDQILIELAKILQHVSREHDVSARYGGDEFALILPYTNKNNALKMAEMLRTTVEEASWNMQFVTLSIGVTTSKKGDTADKILARVDEALYQSKNNGRNQVAYR